MDKKWCRHLLGLQSRPCYQEVRRLACVQTEVGKSESLARSKSSSYRSCRGEWSLIRWIRGHWHVGRIGGHHWKGDKGQARFHHLKLILSRWTTTKEQESNLLSLCSKPHQRTHTPLTSPRYIGPSQNEIWPSSQLEGKKVNWLCVELEWRLESNWLLWRKWLHSQ